MGLTLKNATLSRRLSYATFTVFGVFVLSLLLFPETLPVRSSAVDTPTVTPSITIGGNGSIDFSVTPGTFSTGSASVTVATTNYTGYNLTIAPSTGNSTELVNTSNPNVTIPTITLPSGEDSITSTDFSTPSYGYSLDQTNYKPVSSGTTIKQTTIGNNVTDTFSLTIGARAGTSTPSGLYEKTFTLTATTNPASYSVTYDKNTTDTVSNLPANNDGTLSGDLFYLSTTAPTRSGYSFLGWDTDQNAVTPTYASGAPYTLDLETNNTVTFYAIWGCGSNKICYHGNGDDGTGITSDQGSNTTLIASNFSRPGYGFAGWSTEILDATSANFKTQLSSAISNGHVYGPNQTVDSSLNDNGLDLYAIWVPAEKDGSNNPVYLQGWTGCDTMTAGDVTALTDSRDGSVYAVTKIVNNDISPAYSRCWMIENMRLDVATATITRLNTNRPTAYFIQEATNLSSAYWDASYNPDNDQISYSLNNINRNNTASYNTNNQASSWYSYGGMYNYYTATAGNGGSSKISGNSEGSLCPSGWNLPTGGASSTTDFKSLNIAVNSGTTSTSGGLRTFPTNLVLSGDYYMDNAEARGGNGQYWSSTLYNDGATYSLLFRLSGSPLVYPEKHDVKSQGEAIRCLSSLSETFTLSFNANGGDTSTLPTSQSALVSGGTHTFTLSTTAPTRSGFTFAGWADEDGTVISANTVATGNATYTTGDLNAILYALWDNDDCNPTATTIGTNSSTDAVCLQDMNSTVRGTMTTATDTTGTYTLKDARDNKEYTVAMLPDGNVWMTKNLNYGSTSDILLTSHDTDLPANTPFMAPASTTSFATSSNDASYVTPKILVNDTYGGYYSFASAIASTKKYSTASENITTSICPKGWDLPTSAQYNNLKSAGNLTSYSTALSAPYSFTYAGYRNGTSYSGQTNSIRLWTSTDYSASYAYYTTAYQNASYSSNYKRYGESVRCIMSNGIGTIHYDANGGSNTMDDQTGDINALVVSGNQFTAPSGKAFNGWNTVSNGSGQDVAVGADAFSAGLTNGNTLTLYAQWEYVHTYTYNGNNATDGVMTQSHDNIKEGDQITLYSPNFYKTGFGFAGWSEDSTAQPGGSSTIYGPNETITVPSYGNGNAITLYAVWVAKDTTYTLQTFGSNNRCSTLSVGDVIALEDSRDGEVYTVGKLADGNCWMMENLRLNPSTAKDGSNNSTITASNTRNPSDKFLSTDIANILNGTDTSPWKTCTTADSACIDQISYNSANITNITTSPNPAGTSTTSPWYSYGVSYNWYTATAGYGTYDKTFIDDTMPGDICPTGWHLPYGGSDTGTQGGNTSGGFYYLNYKLNNDTNATDATASRNIRAYPNNFMYSGYYHGSRAYDRGSWGDYWSSKTFDSDNGGGLYFGSSYVYLGTIVTSKYYGKAVRCVASLQETYTLTYNANGGTSAPASQSTTSNVPVEFTVSSTAPTRFGFTFTGWSDEWGTTISAVSASTGNAKYTGGNPNSTLFALWTNDSCNPSATTIGTGNSTDAVCLQDMNSTVRGTMSTATDTTGTYTLKDARDNKEYTIALLPDGNVWMTKNLNYGSDSDTLLTSDDTDIPSGTLFKAPASNSSFSTSSSYYTTPQILINNTYGGYYNYASAIASKIIYDTASKNITTSICPKGWDLPTSAQYNSLKSIAGFTSSADTLVAPYSFTYGGYRNGSSFSGQTSTIRLWTSTNYSNAYAYYSTVYQNASYSNNYKSYGESVRCIMGNGTGTLHYDANGGTGNTNDQTGEINALTVASNSFSAPSGTTFSRWNTSANGTGTPVPAGSTALSAGLTNGNTLTLYAQWGYKHTISYNGNNATDGIMTQTHSNVLEGSTITLYAPNFYKTGYGFAGWSFDQNTQLGGSSTIYGPNETIELPFLGNTGALTLYAVWVAKDTTYNLQTFGANNRCSTLSTGDVIALEDSRDNNVYTVGKLADGNCWMMENLRLNPSTAVDGSNNSTITASNTHSPTTTFLDTDITNILNGTDTSPWKTCTSGTSACDDQISYKTANITNITTSPNPSSGATSPWYSYGVAYNWYTATAGHGIYSTASGGVAQGDICPSSWHLPYGGSGTGAQGGNTSGGFYYLNYKLNNNSNAQNATASNNLRAYPNNFLYSGFYSGSSTTDRGSSGYYRSSMAYSNSNSWSLFFSSSSISPGKNNSSKTSGQAVRCVTGN